MHHAATMCAVRDPVELVAACRKGDHEAWDVLLEEYGRLIWSVALRAGASDSMAEEVFQRTWVAVVEGMGRLREPRRLVSWIASVARHQTYQAFAEARRGRRAGSLEDELGESELAVPPSVEEELEKAEAAAAVRDAAARLTGRCRELVELLFLRDPPADYREISALTGMPVGSIGPTRARCLKRLEKIFRKLYHDPPGRDS